MSGFCHSFVSHVNVYIIPGISLAGILMNALCILTFIRIIRNERLNNHMFKYLLFKSIYDECQFVIQMFAPLYYVESLSSYRSYLIQIWYIYFYYYAESIFELCSGFLELFATFDCLMTIRKRVECTQRPLFFNLTLSLTLLFSCLFYTFRIYDFKIIHLLNATSSLGNESAAYHVMPSDFYATPFSELLKSLHTLIRDALIVIALIVLNIFILRTLKKSIKNKRKLLLRPTSESVTTQLRSFEKESSMRNENNRKNSDETSFCLTNGEQSDRKRAQSFDLIKVRLTQSQSISHADYIERRTKIMVILTGVNYIVGHFPSILFYLPLGFDSPEWICLRHLNLIFFYVSYVTPFFVYFAFNNLFRLYLLKFLKSTFRSHFAAKTSSGSIELTENLPN